MSMSKKDFIALASAIRQHNMFTNADGLQENNFIREHLDTLADFCQAQNPNFMRERWLDYIVGKCGPSGGSK